MLCKGSREAGRQAPAGKTFPRPRDRAARASPQPPGGSEPGTSWEGPRHSLEDPLEDLLTEGSGESPGTDSLGELSWECPGPH